MLVRMSLMKDKDLYKRDWDTEGLVNFIGKHELCRLRGRACHLYVTILKLCSNMVSIVRQSCYFPNYFSEEDLFLENSCPWSLAKQE